jgi:signal transduction histidine kinase
MTDHSTTRPAAAPTTPILAAWALCLLTLGLTAAAFAIRVPANLANGAFIDAGQLVSDAIWLLVVPLAAPAYAAVGTALATQRPGNAVGWLCLALALGVGAEDLAWQISTRAGDVVAPLAPLALALLLLRFPDGALPAPGYWVAEAAAWAGAGLVIVGFALGEAGGPALRPAVPAGAALIGLSLVGGVVALVRRWRRSRGDERLQLAWPAFVVALAVGLLLAGLVLTPLLGGEHLIVVALSVLPVAIVCLGLPAALAVAVLRYRLYAIELLVHRTLVYSALSGAATAIYLLVVGALGALFPAQGMAFNAVAATAAAAAALQPLRAAAVRLVDQLAYGDRAAPYAALAALTRQMGVALPPDAVLPTLVGTVAEALRLPYVAIMLEQHGQRLALAAVGEPQADQLELLLVHRGEPIGRLILGPRHAALQATAAERRLLDDLTSQVGVAAHGVLLQAELQQARERLVRAREEERRRLRRDLHDGLGPTVAGLTLTAEAALDELARDPQAAAELIRELKGDLQTMVADIRHLVHALRPPALDDLGLTGALRLQVGRVAPGLEVAFTHPEVLPPLPAAVEAAAYHIVGEALTNVVRHAGAARAWVRLAVAVGRVEVEVADDGRGLEGERVAGVGLRAMRERAVELGGELRVEPREGSGTLVRAVLPLPVQEQ